MAKYRVYFEKVWDTETHQQFFVNQDFASEVKSLTITELFNLTTENYQEFWNSFNVEEIQ
jgi:hypothetical protein